MVKKPDGRQAFFDFIGKSVRRATGVGELPSARGCYFSEVIEQGVPIPVVTRRGAADEYDAAATFSLGGRGNPVQGTLRDDYIFPPGRTGEIVSWGDAEIEPVQWQTGAHQNHAHGPVLAGQPQECWVSGMAGGKD